MTILLTGADGFIGSYLYHYLSSKSISVIPTFYHSVNLASHLEFSSFISSFSSPPSLIIHCASAPRNSELKYDQDSYINNISMFQNLVNYSLANGIYLVNLASGSDLSRDFWNGSIPDLGFLQHPPDLSDLHGFSKFTISSMIHSINSKYLLNLRLFGVFGEGENYLQKLVPNTIAKLHFNIVPTIVQDRLYDYLDVNDLASFLLSLYYDISSSFWKLDNCSNLNFCTGNLSSIFDIVSYITNKLNPGIVPVLLKPGKGTAYGGSNHLFRSLFPNFQFSSLTDSLDRQVSFYLSRSCDFNKQELLTDSFLQHAKSINK